MSEPVELEVVDSRPNPWITALAASPFALIGVLGACAIVFGQPLLMLVAPHLLIFGVIASIWARIRRPFPRKVPARARLDTEGVTIDDGTTSDRIDAARVTRGVRVPAERPTVQIRQKGAPTRELHLGSDQDVALLLQSLGQDVRTTSASFRVMPRSFTSLWRVYATIFGTMIGTVLAAVAAATVSATLLPVVALTGMALVMVLMLAPSRVEVGGDGVLIRWLGRDRFIRHQDIQSVRLCYVGFGSSKWEAVELVLADRRKVRIPGSRLEENAARILAQRILDAKHAALHDEIAPTALLIRSDRSHREWVEALRKREVIDLRSPAVPKDHLWPVIEDPASDALERAAAVVALGRDLADGDRKRLARVAKVVAAPKLRVVLEEAPDADEEELVQMLEEIEAMSPRTAD